MTKVCKATDQQRCIMHNPKKRRNPRFHKGEKAVKLHDSKKNKRFIHHSSHTFPSIPQPQYHSSHEIYSTTTISAGIGYRSTVPSMMPLNSVHCCTVCALTSAYLASTAARKRRTARRCALTLRDS